MWGLAVKVAVSDTLLKRPASLPAYREAAKLLRKGIKDGARVQGAGPSRYAFPEFPYEISVGG